MKLAAPVLLIVLSALSPTATSQKVDNELLAKVVNYCVVREQSLSMMIDGRDKGILKSNVLAKLPALSAESTDAERATFSRLDDVYGMPKLQTKTLAAHRFYACLQGAMDNRPPTYGVGMNESLLECQAQAGSSEEHGKCVRAAQRAHLGR